MGRRPNSLILQYFERGPKLADASNRYPHTCKLCGENFPKGRIDSLTNHLTKKCPAISDHDRLNACLTLHGIQHPASRGHKGKQEQQVAEANSPPVDLPMLPQRDWTALETLAEVSRQIEASEKQPAEAVNASQQSAGPGAASSSQPYMEHRFDLHDLSALENPPAHVESQQLNDVVQDENPPPGSEVQGEIPHIVQNLTALIQSVTDSQNATNLSMAAIAAARLNPPPQDSSTSSPLSELNSEDASLTDMELSLQQQQQQSMNGDHASAGPSDQNQPAQQTPVTGAGQPWGQLAHSTVGYHGPSIEAVNQAIADIAQANFRLGTTGNGLNDSQNAFRMDSTGNSLNGTRPRHSRSRFDATRRREVQEVRKIGACIRCRILRKTCSKGHPCDTCRKVLAPRVWRSGCVRTKFSEQLDLYSAGVQIVLAQNRINSLKARWPLTSHGSRIVASHFPDKPLSVTMDMLERDLFEEPMKEEPNAQPVPTGTRAVVMIDNESQDVPGRLEAYMRQVLPEFARLEPSHFMRVTLEMALRIEEETKDDLLKKALELWGLVELLDRERQWSIRVISNGITHDWITETATEDQQEVFTTVCLQLAAAAERKAGNISKNLLTSMQRQLQDSKMKIGFSMYFATIILLNSVEKSTWAFKAWEQDNLRPMWPLQKDPGAFSQQGYVIADLLRMLLGIRKALPRTAERKEDGILVTLEDDPVIKEYFDALNLKFDDVKGKQEKPVFSPTDPRSFELLFCSTLLLPARD
ncbi:hypothetical protein GE09DRAFT_1176034 [Coniochaeta sp. 2T2.1]|nr:hypothetical protein GE09DRAFT_1176034 [Coniochaeta sp. 2T2.1]